MSWALPLVCFPLLAWAQTTTLGPSPVLTLPWKTYTATYLPKTSGVVDIYKFNNVRFGDAPTGTMRFGAPSTPTPGVTPPDPEGFIQCHNVSLGSPKTGLGVPFPGKPNAGADPNAITITEDCLFLDIYVPKSVLDAKPIAANVPTIVWIYGGAYVTGAKNGPGVNNPLYTGVGALNAARRLNQDVIFVAGNYRLGAFGWLAGSTVETNGLPNAGLADQRLLFQWVQDHIFKVGGDKTKVSAWGESAGAGSILHHLVTAKSAKVQPPVFRNAMLQSPAYQLQWDRTGVLDQTYKKFASSVPGCPSGSIACLRALPLDNVNLTTANIDFISNWRTNTGQVPFGPAVDGTVIKRLPANEFATKAFNGNLKSILVSHVGDEASIFLPTFSTITSSFTSFVSDFIPQSTLSAERSSILSRYAPAKYPDVADAFSAVIRDGSFTCNTRQLFDAYRSTSTSTYMLYYNVDYRTFGGFKDVLPPVHGSDLLPLFWNPEVKFNEFLIDFAHQLDVWQPGFDPVAGFMADFIKELAHEYQAYLIAHAIFGDPNKGSDSSNTLSPWPTGTDTASSTSVTNVQQVVSPTPQFHIVADEINTSTNCDFWNLLAAQVDPINKTRAEIEDMLVVQDGGNEKYGL